MGISDRIESFILELLRAEENGTVELGRNELAGIFNCVPSQINYVINTRFNADKGFLVESRRGGGGYIRIQRIPTRPTAELIVRIGAECTQDQAHNIASHLLSNGIITNEIAALILSATADRTLCDAGALKNRVRANIMKSILATLSK